LILYGRREEEGRDSERVWSREHEAVVSVRIVKDEEESITQSLLQIKKREHVTECETLDTSEQKRIH
jgi:hypothetical protein